MTGNRTMRRALVFATGLLICAAVGAQEPYGPVKGGDSIYSILKARVLTDDLNLRQWALATMAMNPSAFGDGLSDLQSGAMLNIPSPEQARRQWRRGLAMEAGEVSAPPSVAAQVQAVASNETGVAVPAPVWRQGGQIVTPTSDNNNAVTAPAPAPETAVPSNNTSFSEFTTLPGDQSTTQTPELDAVQSSYSAFVDDPLYRNALARVGNQPSAELLTRLLDLEAQYAGDADYDYVLGVLLLDDGRSQDAIFALLRATQTRPNSLGIRLDLGRAYFEANDNESARSIFSALQQQSPPPAAAEVIDSYLQAIKRRSSRYTPTWVSQITLGGGHDSNANGATDLRNFLDFTLDELSRSTESGFAHLGLNTQWAKPLVPRWRLLLSGQAKYRENFSADEFNTLRYGASTGLSYRRGGWELSGRLSADAQQVDGDDNATTLGLTAGWNWRLSPFTRLQSSARVGTVRYDGALKVRDVDQWLLATGINRRGQLARGSEYSLTLLGGQDSAVKDDSPYGRDLGGVRGTMLVQLTPRVRLQASAQALIADYDGLFFGGKREDVQWSTVLGLQLSDNRAAGWMLAPRISYVDNSSDVGLFEYDRLQVSVDLSRSFD